MLGVNALALLVIFTLYPGEMILLVEDDKASRYAYAWLLRNRGYQVTEAADGSEALLLLNTSEFALVITDIEMPVVNGLALAAYTYARWPQIPILVMSGRPLSEYSEKLLSIRSATFLRKPFDVASLVSTVERLLAARSSRDPVANHGSLPCRQKIGTQTWHVCTACKDWPKSGFHEVSANPGAQLQLCNECRLLLAEGKCL